MIGRELFEEDVELKKFATTPKNQKPSFNWRVEAGETALEGLERLVVAVGEQQRAFDLAEICDTIGSALTDLLLSKGENEIYTEENRRRVGNFARTVAAELASRLPQGGNTGGQPGSVSAAQVHRAIEKALVKHNAHDIARSLVVRRPYLEDAWEESAETDFPRVSTRVIRRNRDVVAWNPAKIEAAVRKAFLSLELDPEPARKIALAISQRVVGEELPYLHIEELQDMVQEELMRQGCFKVAEAYILYRSRRAEVRKQFEQETQRPPAVDPNQDSLILIKEHDGSTSLWDGTELRKRIEFASLGLELCLTPEQIEGELRRSVYAEMTRADLQTTIILNAKTLIEQDADFARFAARILLTFIYEEVLDWSIQRDGVAGLPSAHRRAFKRNLARGVEIGRIHPRLLDFDLDRLADALDPAADLEFDHLGIQTLYDRYLIVDKVAKPTRRIETPQLFWMRVAMGLFTEEAKQPEDHIINLYRLYRSRRFCSSTPTLFNAGTQHSQLSSCYLYKVDDSIESIMLRGIAENAFLSKWAGGLGGSWTSVRGTGSHIHGTNGESQGVIPFLKLHNDQLVAVNQGGKRKGSGCAYLETWHNDIFEFLELRRNVGDDRRRTHDMNTANWIPDLFMKRMEARQHWTLFRSNEVPDLHDLYGKAFEEKYLECEDKASRGEIYGKQVPAIDLWKTMLKMLFETGHPWITFKDPCNVRSPQDHIGVIHSSNLCTEITLNTSEDETAVCNLGSIVIENHLDHEGNIDHDKLRESVRIAVRALDNVIAINFYPTEAARRSNLRHRPIGLGVMGLQNALYLKRIPFASDEAVEFNDEFMEAVAYYAYEASSDLAAERGCYASYKGSKWDRGLLPPDTLDLLEQERGLPIDVPRGGRMDWQPLREKIARQGMRNSNVLAIAPTATISNIMGSSPCIEPAFKHLYGKSNLSGDFTVLNTHLVRDLRKRGLWNKELCAQLKYHHGELAEIPGIPDDLRELYQTAFEIPPQFMIDAAARRQKWIDQSQSLNLFLGKPDLVILSHMYRAAWHSGLKTTYYLRTLGASDIEQVSGTAKKEMRGVVSGATAAAGETPPQVVCRLNAEADGTDCEACQ